jgi:hypothetical protein
VNTTLGSAAAEYLDAVQKALEDLPDDEVAEIVDDVAGHLEQVNAELGGSASKAALEQRLGTPEQYAAELRAAAGFPERGVRRRARVPYLRVLLFLVTWLARVAAGVTAVGLVLMLADGPPLAVPYLVGCAVGAIALGGWVFARRRVGEPMSSLRDLPDARRLERGLAEVKATPWGRATVEFVVSLRPAWWLVRAWVATYVLMFTLGGSPAFPVPRTAVGFAVLAATVIASVWLGRRAVDRPLSGWRRRGQVAGNAALAVLTPAVLVLASYSETYLQFWYEEPYYEPYPAGFYHDDGSPISNLFPYDRDGRLLEGVRIFDQDGRPVDSLEVWEWDECIDAGGWYPGGPQGNVFPRPAVVYRDDGVGQCVDPEDAAPFGSALLGSAAADAGDEPATGEGDEPDTEK